jgi:hypothetical protein
VQCGRSRGGVPRNLASGVAQRFGGCRVHLFANPGADADADPDLGTYVDADSDPDPDGGRGLRRCRGRGRRRGE